MKCLGAARTGSTVELKLTVRVADTVNGQRVCRVITALGSEAELVLLPPSTEVTREVPSY